MSRWNWSIWLFENPFNITVPLLISQSTITQAGKCGYTFESLGYVSLRETTLLCNRKVARMNEWPNWTGAKSWHSYSFDHTSMALQSNLKLEIHKRECAHQEMYSTLRHFNIEMINTLLWRIQKRHALSCSCERKCTGTMLKCSEAS